MADKNFELIPKNLKMDKKLEDRSNIYSKDFLKLYVGFNYTNFHSNILAESEVGFICTNYHSNILGRWEVSDKFAVVLILCIYFFIILIFKITYNFR